MLDFHAFTEGMTAAAMRIVLRDVVSHKATANGDSTSGIISSASVSYRHPVANDLHIITGHAMHRQDRDGSLLQPLVMNMLKRLRIECSIDAHNKGRVIVRSSALRDLAARVAAMHQNRKQ
jgi:hypothetical protein